MADRPIRFQDQLHRTASEDPSYLRLAQERVELPPIRVLSHQLMQSGSVHPTFGRVPSLPSDDVTSTPSCTSPFGFSNPLSSLTLSPNAPPASGLSSDPAAKLGEWVGAAPIRDQQRPLFFAGAADASLRKFASSSPSHGLQDADSHAAQPAQQKHPHKQLLPPAGSLLPGMMPPASQYYASLQMFDFQRSAPSASASSSASASASASLPPFYAQPHHGLSAEQSSDLSPMSSTSNSCNTSPMWNPRAPLSSADGHVRPYHSSHMFDALPSAALAPSSLAPQMMYAPQDLSVSMGLPHSGVPAMCMYSPAFSPGYSRPLSRSYDTMDFAAHHPHMGESSAAHVKKRARRKPRLCMNSGCTRLAQQGGRCIAHGGGRRCSVEECTRSAQKGRLCARHGGKRLCIMDGCEKYRVKKALCLYHLRLTSQSSKDA